LWSLEKKWYLCIVNEKAILTKKQTNMKTFAELKNCLQSALEMVEMQTIKLVSEKGLHLKKVDGVLITDIHHSGGKSINTYVRGEDCITEEFEILAIKNENGKLSILPFYEECMRLSTFFEMDYDEDENQFDECLKEWLDIHKNWWEDLHSGIVETDATLLSIAQNIDTHLKFLA
jgi:hypothetical protein